MSTFYQLDFERPITELDAQIERLQSGGDPIPPGVAPFAMEDAPSIESLRAQREKMLADLYKQLSPWDTVRVARHPARPQGRDYIERMCRDFCELHGDRRFGDDPAIVTGFGRIGAHKCLVVAHHKGRSTKEKLACHFGCAHPEGYRKALAKMQLAEKFGTPIVTLVDTPGAYPGLGAEERGQAEAIAVNLREMSRLRVPIVSVVIGEGGSGGALGIAVANRVAMLKHSWYSVISPEGCAAILWKQANEQTNAAAAQALQLTASDNLRLGIVDAVVEEPVGGAHRDPESAARMLGDWISLQLDELEDIDQETLLQQRYDRFRAMGAYHERAEIAVPSEPVEVVTNQTNAQVEAKTVE
ncbi:MAG: acetyl-CoA carboxylase carboxyltransferase subunit alpha [Phycisphaeraceae bacterium]|nr:acetyl-CoA carboxylase carboxyltransferase subunit alpha [Phycisphaerales bacterium]MCB9861124.1 acetyl-CoA carboxylase carboxyltransferase subunit alpha [Phycisphaeraceae bacterium]